MQPGQESKTTLLSAAFVKCDQDIAACNSKIEKYEKDIISEENKIFLPKDNLKIKTIEFHKSLEERNLLLLNITRCNIHIRLLESNFQDNIVLGLDPNIKDLETACNITIAFTISIIGVAAKNGIIKNSELDSYKSRIVIPTFNKVDTSIPISKNKFDHTKYNHDIFDLAIEIYNANLLNDKKFTYSMALEEALNKQGFKVDPNSLDFNNMANSFKVYRHGQNKNNKVNNR